MPKWLPGAVTFLSSCCKQQEHKIVWSVGNGRAAPPTVQRSPVAAAVSDTTCLARARFAVNLSISHFVTDSSL